MNKDLYIKYLEKIDDIVHRDKNLVLRSYYRLFILLLEHFSEDETLHFTSLFSRIAYVGARIKMKGSHLFLLHTLRRAIENEYVLPENIDQYISLARFNVVHLMNTAWNTHLVQKIALRELLTYFKSSDKKVVSYKAVVSGIMIQIDLESKHFHFIPEDQPTITLNVRYDIADQNEIFTAQIQKMTEWKRLPIPVNLVDVEVLEDGWLVPKAYVFEPDYLVDVTAIAGAFKYYGTESLEYVLNKFLPQDFSKALMVGNIANYILDELVNDPDITFEALLPAIFRGSALTFSCLRDEAVNEILRDAKLHFKNLKACIEYEFKREDIDPFHSYLEPSFFSRDYGMQGRLDLLHEHHYKRHFDIIELKSGSPFMTNHFGLSVQHYTQTLLYDLMVKSVFEGRKNTSNFILYSKESEKQLRVAPPVKPQQYEAIKVRNDIILMEEMLSREGDPQSASIIEKVMIKNFPRARGFSKTNVERFSKTYNPLDPLEKEYYKIFTGFIAREHRLAKTGEHGMDKSNGLASIWLEDQRSKEERFSILHGLVIIKNETDQDIPVITLAKSDKSPDLSRFRVGDIVVFYPDEGNQAVLRNQIFKCSIIGMDDQSITLKLRSRQYNHRIFREHPYWAIENDMLDSSFLSMYKSLFEWASSGEEQRQLLLGRKAPDTYAAPYQYTSEELTEEQNHLLNQMISARNYFLLWGPPGTGKTSIMVKHFIRFIHHYTEERLLVLAYTNKAVDEICSAALEGLGEYPEELLRIGSYHSCDPQYRSFLLDHRLEELHTRKEVLSFLRKKRIVIATVSSILNRPEIFRLYSFNRVIIDEASQILEPMVLGLLTRFPLFILIGDHKQLPAVVVQSPAHTMIQNKALSAIGFHDAASSFFERLYMQCRVNGWTHAIGILTAQGRMHKDLMHFPNEYFYSGQLKVIDKIERLNQSLEEKFPTAVDHPFVKHRLIFIPAPVDEALSWKTNLYEAEICKIVIAELVKIMKENGLPFHSESIGIITPYRAQIALIIKQLHDTPYEETYQRVSVDTVERYQGGARDNVIISLCTNRFDQLEHMVSLTGEGIDRKLNVALTRARERIIITGNKSILMQNNIYRALLERCHTLENVTSLII
ncbi:MAG TPA: AAA domain-containing protein [Saprospiraceae bacterium]|nr:AAA domain-containing protein [Saprospiraceae bacterium]